MNYNVNEIKELLKFFNPEHFTEDDIDKFIEDFGNQNCVPNFTWDAGATKCVIIPCNYDYVIKIPFDGERDWENDDAFRYYYNGGGEEGWNYCELEQEYWYEKIEGSEFSKFFIMPESLDVNPNWPIYIQPKVDVCSECQGKPHYSSVDSLYKVRTEVGSVTYLPDTWLAVVLENLNNDLDKLNEFIDFLDEFSDLRMDNLGFIGNQAVIIDYAGFGD